MSAETQQEPPRRGHAAKMRAHDYLYDSAFIVSGARDYARMAFKSAMASAQVILQPVYQSMFSEMRMRPRIQVVYYPNCRLPQHVDRSYSGYQERVREAKSAPTPDFNGKDRFKYSAVPKQVLSLNNVTPTFHPPTPTYVMTGPTKPRSRGTQSRFRESSAQTIPWQPDGKAAAECENTPEVLYLDQLEWGPGCPYRTGDLPADFHTTEIINKLRHARTWTELVERGCFPRWMKKRDAIISDIETKDWIFREAEIDELQDIRLELLHRMQQQQRFKQTNRTSKKLAMLWAAKKHEMEKKIDHIRRTRDRELRKLAALHEGGGRVGQVARMRAARGGGDATGAACDPTSDLHAPLARHGYQARSRHAHIYYDPSLLSLEDHQHIAAPPAWLEQCGQDLQRTCSGHYPPRDPTKLCERETKWSEQFLESLHNDLKKARLGAALVSSGPLHVLKPRRLQDTPRPATPVVESVSDADEANHQAALVLQRIIRGRAVQNLMYEGRTRAAELTEELKTTHGLQKEDKIRISKEESKAREYNAMRTEAEQKDDAVTALVDELCGGAVAAALDFLEKELRRLKEERRQHAFILIALREKTMREAAEAGRRQKEEHRRREHDEMFKQILGVTQETVDTYLHEIVTDGVELAAEAAAVKLAEAEADRIDLAVAENTGVSVAEQNELVAQLVQQFLLPNVHKTAARHRIAEQQRSKLEAARKTIFKLVDDAEKLKEAVCTRCGVALGHLCRCRVCPITNAPQETVCRDDLRWKHTRARPGPPERSTEERYPPLHEIRCMLNAMVDDVVVSSRRRRSERDAMSMEIASMVRHHAEGALDAREFVERLVERVVDDEPPPARAPRDYRHLMLKVVKGALERTEPYPTSPCPKELPSEIRRRADEKAAAEDPTCRCEMSPVTKKPKIKFGLATMSAEEKRRLLPTELRMLEEMRRCKCDTSPTPSPTVPELYDDTTTEVTVATDATDATDAIATEGSTVPDDVPDDMPEQDDRED